MLGLDLLFTQILYFSEQKDIFLEVVKGEETSWTFLAPHENERVVNRYVAEQITRHGGTFVVLRQQGKRHVELNINGNRYEIDPNRIYTHRGRTSTLRRLNPEFKQAHPDYEPALARTESLADFILSTMSADSATDWIAIHNNTNGYDNDCNHGRGTISIKRYQKKLAAGANYLIKVNDANIDEDDLFFITAPQDFISMSDANWNVVLQNPAVANDPNEDDGSLSVLAEMRGKRYINVEAERQAEDGFGEDHLTEQMQMVDLTFKLLKERKKDE